MMRVVLLAALLLACSSRPLRLHLQDAGFSDTVNGGASAGVGACALVYQLPLVLDAWSLALFSRTLPLQTRRPAFFSRLPAR